jgi:hypothetical protein
MSNVLVRLGTLYRDPRRRGDWQVSGVPSACWRATLGAVDQWPLAKSLHTTKLGVSPGRYPLRRDLRKVSLSIGVHVALWDGASALKLLCSGQPCGKLSGGNWMVVRGRKGFVPRAPSRCDAFYASLISEQLYPHGSRLGFGSTAQDCYLVDSASSHMLVSKIKPCMSKYKQSIQ